MHRYQGGYGVHKPPSSRRPKFIYTYIYIYACMYAHTYIRSSINQSTGTKEYTGSINQFPLGVPNSYIHIYIYTYMYIYTHTHTYIHPYMNLPVQKSTRGPHTTHHWASQIHVCICTYIYIYNICIYTYMFIYIHTHPQINP